MASGKKKRVSHFPRRVDEAGPRGEHAYLHLVEAIQSGRLRSGDRLREIELAAWLGSSRTPVREALHRLATEGMVVRDAVRGMIIAEFDPSSISELYEMREAVEATAAGLAARHASDVEIAALREFGEMERKIVEGDLVALTRNNRAFHDAIYRSAHNRYLLKISSSLKQSMIILGQTTLSVAGRSKGAIAEHHAIIDAVERRDPKAAEEAARTHMRAAYRARLRLATEGKQTRWSP
jgi:DNA-binding GntR family transcriptional regulator